MLWKWCTQCAIKGWSHLCGWQTLLQSACTFIRTGLHILAFLACFHFTVVTVTLKRLDAVRFTKMFSAILCELTRCKLYAFSNWFCRGDGRRSSKRKFILTHSKPSDSLLELEILILQRMTNRLVLTTRAYLDSLRGADSFTCHPI